MSEQNDAYEAYQDYRQERKPAAGAGKKSATPFKSCPDCGNTISKRALSCPHCGWHRLYKQCKRVSGRTPISIINEHAMKLIKYQLKHSDKSIKEVANHFDFANPSFFGKFVKTHTGMSPMQLRNSEESRHS